MIYAQIPLALDSFKIRIYFVQRHRWLPTLGIRDKLVFVTYEGRTTDGQRFRNTEILTVRGGRITEVEVYFGWSIPHEA